MRAVALLALAAGARALSTGLLEDAALATDGEAELEKPKGFFKLDWEFHDGSSEVDAYVWMMNERKLSSMYDPLILTLGEALHGVGANVAVVWEKNRDAMFRNVSASIERGRKPLVVTIASYYADPDGGRKILRKISDLGAFVVLYQTEPIERNAHLADMIELFKPTEIWDYSHRNLDWYPEASKKLYRYMPPGYAKGLDLGVDQTSNARMEQKVGFLGGWQYRPQQMTDLYHRVFEGRMVSREDVWTKEDTIKFLTEYPVQLNTHKEENCCPSTNPVEAFRMAQIVSNKGCIISAHSDPRDEAEWEGIVHFAEASKMGELFEEVSRDVRGCQTASFEKFKSKFEPAAILRRSKFLDVWQPGH